MRHLLLLRGAPGSGKSTFVKTHHLEPYTLCADELRLLMQSPVTNPDGTFSISQKNDHAVWDLLYQIMETRMARGEFVVIDATHSRAAWLNKYKPMVDKYRYRVHTLEFDPPMTQLMARNKLREPLKRVPFEYVETSATRIATQPLPTWAGKIDLLDWMELAHQPMLPFDFSKYRKIHHFGDLHGCLEPLRAYFEKYPYTEEDYYIFLGDYVDRGIQNGALMNFLHDELLGKKNVLFLEGNHDGALRMWGNEEEVKKREFLYRTVPDLLAAGFDRTKARAFTRRLGQMAWYQFRDQLVFANHAGHPHLPSIFTPTDELIYGVGKYEDMETVAHTFATTQPAHIFQVCGHRNVNNLPIQMEGGRVFNLCDRIEYGGYLRVAVLDRAGWVNMYLENPIHASDPDAVLEIPASATETPSPLRALIESREVQKVTLQDNIVSFNFKREVFYKKKWDEVTTRARGLFVEMSTGQIVARAYDKFFNLGERRETEYVNLRKNLTFPVKCWEKENGFLGLIGYNPVTDQPVIVTKSTDRGAHVGYFKEVMERTGFDLALATAICKTNLCTLVFEVIDPINDPHIIEYAEPRLYLLEMIKNDFAFQSYRAAQDIAEDLGCAYKNLVHEFTTWEEFSSWYATVEEKYFYTPYPQDFPPTYVEGFVLEDQKGFMVKIKTKYYQTWKKLRGVLDSLQKGRGYNTAWLTSPLENQVYAWMKSKGREALIGKNILEVRNWYEQENRVQF